jgi:hypothetical protein
MLLMGLSKRFRIRRRSPYQSIVQLNPVWYLIGDEQQDRVTDRMWLQARANHLTKLELRDGDGNSIARSPVVGQHMVILQRRQSY